MWASFLYIIGRSDCRLKSYIMLQEYNYIKRKRRWSTGNRRLFIFDR